MIVRNYFSSALAIFLLLFGSHAKAQFYQGAHQEFGKSGINHLPSDWKSYHYKRFRVYYSDGNEAVATYAARAVHHYLELTEEKLDHQFPEQIDVVVYESQHAFRQSNLAITKEEQYSEAGESHIVGTKVVLYFEGDRQQFNRRIKSAVYEVVVRHLLFGGDWKDQLRTALNPAMPSWLERGLVRYLTEEWNEETESKVKDLILTKKTNRFNSLTEEEKSYMGASVWYYVVATRGRSVLPTILYTMRINRSIERSFLSLLGVNFAQLTRNYTAFYRSKYLKEYERQEEPKGQEVFFKQKKGAAYGNVRLSPDGTKVAYVEYDRGNYRIKLKDVLTLKARTIHTEGAKMKRTRDISFPALQWHPNGQVLAFFTQFKGKTTLFTYALSSQSLTRRALKNRGKVLDFDYGEDGKQLVLSAAYNGQSDLYLYQLSSGKMLALTNDSYDDLTPRFIDGGKRLVFASNRPTDTVSTSLPALDVVPYNHKNDLFILNLRDKKRAEKRLERLTNTPDVNETSPFEIAKDTYLFLSDENGINNEFLVEKKVSPRSVSTTKISPKTNYVTSIRMHDVNRANQLLLLIYQNNAYRMMTQEATPKKIANLPNTTYVERRMALDKKLEKMDSEREDTVDMGAYRYQKEIIAIGALPPDSSRSDFPSKKTASKADKRRQLALGKPYAPDFVTYQTGVRFDNLLLFPHYQMYTENSWGYANPELQLSFKMAASDVLDRFKLSLGIRTPIALNAGSELLLMGEHLKNRIHHRLLFYRQKSVERNVPSPRKRVVQDMRYRLSVPLSQVWSIRTTAHLRNDRDIAIPVNEGTLAEKTTSRYHSGLKTAVVLDNTIPIAINIRSGSRAKLFAEYLQEWGGDAGYTVNVGIDARSYSRIRRNFIWVNRFAAGTSLGSKRVLYYMGGIDNWTLRASPDFNQAMPVDTAQKFGFQTTAAPLRGFIQNSRNGNSFALYTTELRLPISRFLFPYPIKMEAVRHFQLIAFGDVGTAWTGPHPFHPTNHFKLLGNEQNPIVGGVGFGLRTQVNGFFLRLDIAWGIEGGKVQQSIPYFSFTKDI